MSTDTKEVATKEAAPDNKATKDKNDSSVANKDNNKDSKPVVKDTTETDMKNGENGDSKPVVKDTAETDMKIGENGEILDASAPVEPSETYIMVSSSPFNERNFFMLITFLVVYTTIYFVLGFFNNFELNFQKKFSLAIDALFMIGILGATIVFYVSMEDYEKIHYVKEQAKYLKDYINSDMSFFYQLFIIISMYLLVFLFRIPMSNYKSSVILMIETLAWLLLIVIGINKFFKFTFNQVNLIDDFYAWLFPKEEEPVPEIDMSLEIPMELDNKEVFNIANNKYTFDEAQAICKAYGADLASYNQIEQAYSNGAEWCNYGWSANQMAFFPTQKSTWDELQKSEKRKHACGRPGVNGGYMANPNIRFGVNCYGVKPEADSNDIQGTGPVIAQTKEEKEIDERVKYWMDNKEQHLQVNSHNYSKWSEHH